MSADIPPPPLPPAPPAASFAWIGIAAAALFAVAIGFGVATFFDDASPAIEVPDLVSSTLAPDIGPGNRVFNHPPLLDCWTDSGHYLCYDQGGGTWDVTEICAAYPDTAVCASIP